MAGNANVNAGYSPENNMPEEERSTRNGKTGSSSREKEMTHSAVEVDVPRSASGPLFTPSKNSIANDHISLNVRDDHLLNAA